MSRDLFKLFGEAARGSKDSAATAPQSLTDIAADPGEQDAIVRQAGRALETQLRVDYSDFANHVFLNSALSYFNLTGEKILSEYPMGGTRGELEAFIDDLDGYQRHVLQSWPVRSGHLVFRPSVSASYVQIDDVGNEEGVTKTALLNPGTGSWSVELWYNSSRTLTGSQDTSFLIQKGNGAGTTVSMFLSASSVFFQVVSGASSTQVSAPAHIGSSGYVLGVIDRSASTSGTLLIYTGSLTAFPRLVSSGSISFGGQVGTASGSFFIGSGTLSTKNHVPYSGTVDEVRVWRAPLDRAESSSSFNRKVYARGSLMGMWRFNETGSSGISGLDSVVLDSSGHLLNGRIRNYWSGARGSGSLVYETPDPIVDVNCREVLSFILEQQESGSDYDRNNHGKITDMFPQAFLETQEEQDQDIVRNFLYVMARHFDRIKLYADHLQYALRVNESEFDQAADSTLEDVARFFGWELPGGFSDAGALQYLIGRDVQGGESSNEEIDRKLHDIKTAVWRRLLSNLSRIYKTKGTRESVRSILNSHGVPSNIFRIKEYGYSSRSAITTERVSSERSSYALTLGSGTLTGSVSHSSLSSSLELYPSSSLTIAGSSSFIQFEQMAQSFPSSSAQFFALTGARPRNIWLMQETGGDGITCSITGERLGKESSYTSAICGATASGFWHSEKFTGKKCVEFAGNSSSGVLTGSATTAAPNSGSFAFLCVFRAQKTGSIGLGLLGKYGGGVGYYLATDVDQLLFVTRDPGSLELKTTGSLFDDGAWHVAAIGRSIVSGTNSIITDQEYRSLAAPLVTGSIDNSTAFILGDFQSPSPSLGAKMQIAYLAYFTGSDAEQILGHGGNPVRKSFWTHASASQIDYRRFGEGIIYSQVGSDEYGVLLAPSCRMRPGRDWTNQVVYLRQSGFSGSQEVGILSLPSYTNYLKYPTDMTNWTTSSVTINPGVPETAPLRDWKLSPWRTYSSSVITGSSTTGHVYMNTDAVLTGSQWYCFSVYLRKDLAGVATIELQDITGSVIATKQVVAFPWWDRYHVSGVLPPGSTSARAAIYSGQKGFFASFVSADGAQLNEGHYPLPLITDNVWGYAATLPSTRTALTGTFIRANISPRQVPNSAGRMDVLYTTLDHQGVSGSILGRIHPTEVRRTLVDAHNGNDQIGRRQLFIESGTLDRMGTLIGDTATSYELQMTASTSFSGSQTAISIWNATQPSVPNISVGNAGLMQSTSQSFTPGALGNSHLFIGHSSASADTSGSNHLYGAVSRITMYSGSITTTQSYVQHGIDVRDFSVETRVMWPSSASLVMPASEASGSLWLIRMRDEDSSNHHLTWKRTSADAKTGSLILVVGSASLTASSLPIFDDRWYNVHMVKDTVTGSYTLRVSRYDDGEVAYSTSSVFHPASMASPSYRVTGSIVGVFVGSSGSLKSQQWMDEFRVWSRVLTDEEMDDHCLYYRSFGNESVRDVPGLLLHWRLDDGVAADSAGRVSVLDHSLNERHGTGSFWQQGVVPFRRFLNGYSYIGSPDFGWSENKTRVFPGNSLSREDTPRDSRLFALEMSLADQLNEDISQMMSSMDEMNDALGHGASMYRPSYAHLDTMRREYFRRITDRVNHRVFVDMLDFFDRSFVSIIRKVIPASAIFFGDEVVVESHMLERSKVEYAAPTHDRAQDIGIEGVIRIYRR